jgi:hypothetical protein
MSIGGQTPPDRRKGQEPYSGEDRRYVSRMSTSELQLEVYQLRDRLERIEDLSDKVSTVSTSVAELSGTVKTLSQIVTGRFDGLDKGIEAATGVKTAITFASVVIVPIIIALIGGYFALKTGVGAK